MTNRDRYQLFQATGNRLRARALWAWALGQGTSEFFDGAIEAYRASHKWVEGLTATPAPTPVVNPSNYPDPISYLNRCRYFKRAMILSERRCSEADYHELIPTAAALSSTYHDAQAAYDASVERAMSLSLPYPPFMRQGADGRFPF